MADAVDDLDTRGISRGVLADMGEAWLRGWQLATRMQEENPALRAIALQSPADPVEALDALVPVLAYTHPTFHRAVHALLQATIDELRAPPVDRVSPAEYGRTDVRSWSDEVDTETGGGQQYDRVAMERIEELEAENEHLKRTLAAIVGLVEAAGASPDHGVVDSEH